MIECGAGGHLLPWFHFLRAKKAKVAGHARLGKKNAIGIG